MNNELDRLTSALAVDAQEADPDSTLHFFRRLAELRRSSPALRQGDLEFIDSPEDVLAFTRSVPGEQVLCVFNLGSTSVDWTPPNTGTARLICSVGIDVAGIPGSLNACCGYLAVTKES